MYTHDMHNEFTALRPDSQRGVVIDCSDWRSSDSDLTTSFDALVQWVRSLSPHSPVHVYMRSQLSGCIPRRYQTQLQSLRCTVTAKVCCG